MYIYATLCIGACTALASCTHSRPHSFLQRRRARPARECRMWELTHHSVRGGGKIPRPSVSGFLPPPCTSWWVNCAIPTAHVVSLLKRLQDVLKFVNTPESFLRLKKLPSSKCLHLDFKLCDMKTFYTVCLRLLEMLPSTRLHKAFKWLKWKWFIDRKCLQDWKKSRLQNVFILTSSQKIWSRLQYVFKIFQLNASKTSLWRLQIINVLKTSSIGL